MRFSDPELFRPADIPTALALLTRLPVTASFERSARAAWAYPLAGMVLALLASATTGLVLLCGVPAPLAALVWLATTILASGAMHEDGLADCADGFWGGWEPSRRLEIMKDSQIGTYGVLALVIGFAARWWAVSALIGAGNWFWPLMAVAIASRALMPWVMHALPHARASGLSHAQGSVARDTALAAAGLGLLAALLLTGWNVIPVVLFGLSIAGGMVLLARDRINGQTGDVLGATQQVAEVVFLAVLVT